MAISSAASASETAAPDRSASGTGPGGSAPRTVDSGPAGSSSQVRPGAAGSASRTAPPPSSRAS